jgi:hypothetical protein
MEVLSIVLYLLGTQVLIAYLYLDSKRFKRELGKIDADASERIKAIEDQLSTLRIQSGIKRRGD